MYNIQNTTYYTLFKVIKPYFLEIVFKICISDNLDFHGKPSGKTRLERANKYNQNYIE